MQMPVSTLSLLMYKTVFSFVELSHCMKVSLKVWPISLAAVTILSCDLRPTPHSKAAIIEHLLDSLHYKKIFNGAIVIGQGDSIIFCKGYGCSNFNDSIPFTVNTVSDGGSLAKTFTAAALWKLQKQGRLSLDDPVQKFLPAYPYPNTLIQDLIMHNAGGLPGYDYFYPQIPDSAILTNELMLEILSEKKPPLMDETRKNFNYENCGIDLAALIIETVAGETYQKVLSDLFFRPLKMDSTHVRPALLSQWTYPRTIGYRWLGDSLIFHDLADREGFYGSCNLLFTTSDLYKWGVSFYSSKINNDILDERTKPGLIAGKISGLNQLNWYYSNNKNAYYYWGNNFGFYSLLYYDNDKKFTIAFMTNTTLPYRFRQPLVSSLVEIMEHGTIEKDHFALPSLQVIENRDDFLGVYTVKEGDSIHIFKGEKLFHIQRNNELRYNIFVVDSVTGYVPGIDAWVLFSKEDNKLVLHWNSIFSEQRAVR